MFSVTVLLISEPFALIGLPSALSADLGGSAFELGAVLLSWRCGL
jgi:hypothetical protein